MKVSLLKRRAIISFVTAPKQKNSNLLRSAGLRCTKVRLAVLDILTQNGQPLCATQILERLPTGIDRVTLYRTLNALTDKRLLHRVHGDDQIWRYGVGDVNPADRHGHAHFVCDSCGAVECLSDTPVPEGAAKRSGVRAGYRIDYSEVLVHGACPDCR
jgi:Fur family ferric uptake transcriptional regulator